MTEEIIDVNTPNLWGDSIEAMKSNQPAVEPTDPVVPVTPATPAPEVVPWEEPKTPNMITPEELLAQKTDAENLEAIRKKDEDLEAEVKAEIAELTKQDAPQEPEKEDPITDIESDELGWDYKAQLQKIKQFTDNKITEAEKRVYNAESRLESEIISFETKENLYKEAIRDLNTKLVKQQTTSIPSDDDSVVRYNYLRNQFKTNKDDKQAVQDLWNFHLTRAATFFWMDPKDLNQLIINSRQAKNNQQAALAWWYNQGGGVSTQVVRPRKPQATKLNQDLLRD